MSDDIDVRQYTAPTLAAAAGVNVHQIKAYVKKGLLPGPGPGSGPRFTERHLRRLRLITALFNPDAHTLEELRDRLDRDYPF